MKIHTYAKTHANPKKYSLGTPNGKELEIASSEDIRVLTSLKEYGQKFGEVLHTKRETN